MTTLEDLLAVLPYVIFPQLELLEIVSLLLTSKSIHTVVSRSMKTIYQAHFPNDPIDPNTTETESYWTQRFLVRTGPRQVYVKGDNRYNRLCLSRFPHLNTKTTNGLYSRSVLLSRLGIKKFALTNDWLIALSVKGKVYFISESDGEQIPDMFEWKYQNEFMVDVATTRTAVFAISNTGRLYYWCWRNSYSERISLELVDFNIGAVVRQKKARVTAITTSKLTAALLVQDVGVVLWDERQYNKKACLVPRVSDSLDLGWDVIDVGIMGGRIVLVLRNGSLFMYQFCPYEGFIRFSRPHRYKFHLPCVDRVWCGWGRWFVRTHGRDLYEIKNDGTNLLLTSALQVSGIDAARIRTIHLGRHFNCALLDDGTLHGWQKGRSPVKLEYRYVVSFARAANRSLQISSLYRDTDRPDMLE